MTYLFAKTREVIGMLYGEHAMVMASFLIALVAEVIVWTNDTLPTRARDTVLYSPEP